MPVLDRYQHIIALYAPLIRGLKLWFKNPEVKTGKLLIALYAPLIRGLKLAEYILPAPR